MNINEILEQHQIWLETSGKEGIRANFCGANLRGVNLRDTNLRGADLNDADLCGTNFCNTNLFAVSLRGAKVMHLYQKYS